MPASLSHVIHVIKEYVEQNANTLLTIGLQTGVFKSLENAIKEHHKADILLFQSHSNNHEKYSFAYLTEEKYNFSGTELLKKVCKK